MHIPESDPRNVSLNPCFNIIARNSLSKDRKNMWMPAPYTKVPITVKNTVNTRGSDHE